MRRKWLIAGAVLIMAAAIAGILAWTARSPHQPSVRPAPSLIAVSEPQEGDDRRALPAAWQARLDRFQADAETACQCARRSPASKKACWAKFEHEIAPYPHSEEISMCEPIAPKSTCFDDAGFGACVTIEYSAIPNASFCTRAEASAAATLYSRADTDRIEGRSSETGEQALIRFSRALAEGAPVPKVAPAGCGA